MDRFPGNRLRVICKTLFSLVDRELFGSPGDPRLLLCLLLHWFVKGPVTDSNKPRAKPDQEHNSTMIRLQLPEARVWQPAPFEHHQRFRLERNARLCDPGGENLFRLIWYWCDRWDVLVPLLRQVKELRDCVGSPARRPEHESAHPIDDRLRETIWVHRLVEFVTSCCAPGDIHFSTQMSGALREQNSALLCELRTLIDTSGTGFARYDEHLEKATVLLDNYVEDPFTYQQYQTRTLLDRAEILESNRGFLDQFVQEEIALRVERAFEEEDWELISHCFAKDKRNSFGRTLVMRNLTRGLDGEYKENPYSLGEDGPISFAFADRRYLHVDQWPNDPPERFNWWRALLLAQERLAFRVPARVLCNQLAYLDDLWTDEAAVVRSMAEHDLTVDFVHAILDALENLLNMELGGHAPKVQELRARLPPLVTTPASSATPAGRSRAPASPIPSAPPSPIPSATPSTPTSTTPSTAASSASSPRQSDPTTRPQNGAEHPSPVPTDPPSPTSSPGLHIVTSSADDQDRNAETSYAAYAAYAARGESGVDKSQPMVPSCPTASTRPPIASTTRPSSAPRTPKSLSAISTAEVMRCKPLTPLTPLTLFTPLTSEAASENVSQKGVKSVSGVSGVSGVSPLEKLQASHVTGLTSSTPSTPEQVRSPSSSPSSSPSPSPATFRSEPASENVSQTGVKSVSGVSGVRGLVRATSAVETEELQSPSPPRSPRYVRPPSPRYVSPPYVDGASDDDGGQWLGRKCWLVGGSDRVSCTVVRVKRRCPNQLIMDVKLDSGGVEVDVLEECLERESAASVEPQALPRGKGKRKTAVTAHRSKGKRTKA